MDRFIFICFVFLFVATVFHACQGFFPATLGTPRMDRRSLLCFVAAWAVCNAVFALVTWHKVRQRAREVEAQAADDTRGDPIVVQRRPCWDLQRSKRQRGLRQEYDGGGDGGLPALLLARKGALGFRRKAQAAARANSQPNSPSPRASMMALAAAAASERRGGAGAETQYRTLPIVDESEELDRPQMDQLEQPPKQRSLIPGEEEGEEEMRR